MAHLTGNALVRHGSFASKAAEAVRPCTSAAPSKADVNSTPRLPPLSANTGLLHRSKNRGRGRDASYLAPPAQIRTCSFPAYGSHLGYPRQLCAAVCEPASVTRLCGAEY